MNEILEIFKIPLLTAFFTIILGWFSIYVKNKLNRLDRKENEKLQKQREVFDKMLSLYSRKLSSNGVDNNWLQDFEIISKDLVIWANDKVLYEFSQYSKALIENNKDYEIYFAKTIEAFRKHIGYKNRFNKIKPQDFLNVFKAGWQKEL